MDEIFISECKDGLTEILTDSGWDICCSSFALFSPFSLIFSRLFGFMRWFEPICEGSQSINHGSLLKKVSFIFHCFN